jgi:DnaK suppressor protein
MGWVADLTVEMGRADSYTPRPSRNGVVRTTMRPVLPPDYRPGDQEEFMNPLQVEYFRQKLLRWRAELLADSSGTLRHLKEESLLKPDLTDRASLETERAIELRTRDRERKLISKIDAALARIDGGTYGFCEETEQPIGIRRLEARPIATLSIEAQERHERMERTYRDE